MVYREGDTHGRYEFKREHQAKLVPTTECHGLEVLENVNTSDGRANRDDFLSLDLWPNFNAMVTKLHESYIGSHEEKFCSSATRVRSRFFGLVHRTRL